MKMRTMKSVLGKVLVSAMLVLGLTAASCNQRSGEVKVKEDREGNEEVRIRERQNTDSVDIKRDQTIERDEDGYGDTKVKDNTKIDMERDRNEGQGGNEGNQGNRGTNQGNDRSGDAASKRK